MMKSQEFQIKINYLHKIYDDYMEAIKTSAEVKGLAVDRITLKGLKNDQYTTVPIEVLSRSIRTQVKKEVIEEMDARRKRLEKILDKYLDFDVPITEVEKAQ